MGAAVKELVGKEADEDEEDTAGAEPEDGSAGTEDRGTDPCLLEDADTRGADLRLVSRVCSFWRSDPDAIAENPASCNGAVWLD